MKKQLMPGFRSSIADIGAVCAAVLLGITPVALGQDDLSEVTGEQLVRTSVFASIGTVQPGERFELGIRYQLEPNWHIYWRNPGASGMPPTVNITAPEGFTVGAIQWPTPEVFRDGEITYGYGKEAVFIVPVTAPETLEGGMFTFKVELEWLVCRKACLFGAREHTIKLPAGRPGRVVPGAAEDMRLLAAWRARMPIPMSKAASASAKVVGEHLIMSGPAGSSTSVLFYPGDTPGVQPAVEQPVQGRVVDGRYLFDMPLTIEPENALDVPLRAAGLVVLGTPGGVRSPRSIAINVPLEGHRKKASPPADDAPSL